MVWQKLTKHLSAFREYISREWLYKIATQFGLYISSRKICLKKLVSLDTSYDSDDFYFSSIERNDCLVFETHRVKGGLFWHLTPKSELIDKRLRLQWVWNMTLNSGGRWLQSLTPLFPYNGAISFSLLSFIHCLLAKRCPFVQLGNLKTSPCESSQSSWIKAIENLTKHPKG